MELIWKGLWKQWLSTPLIGIGDGSMYLLCDAVRALPYTNTPVWWNGLIPLTPSGRTNLQWELLCNRRWIGYASNYLSSRNRLWHFRFKGKQPLYCPSTVFLSSISILTRSWALDYYRLFFRILNRSDTFPVPSSINAASSIEPLLVIFTLRNP